MVVMFRGGIPCGESSIHFVVVVVGGRVLVAADNWFSFFLM